MIMFSAKTIRNAINWNSGEIAQLKQEMAETNPFDIDLKRDIQRDIDRCHRNIKQATILLAMVEWSQFRNSLGAAISVGV